jgi:predicted phage tail protein
VTDADLTGYQIYVDETPVGTVGADTAHYRVDALATGYHSARVVAVNAVGFGVTSAPTAFWVDASPPPPPAAPTVTAAAQYHGILRGTLQISWPSVQDPDSDIASYRVFVGDSLVATTTTAGDQTVQVSAEPTGAYRVRVDAVNGAGLTATGATTTIRVDSSSPVLWVPTIALRPGATAAGTPVTITAPAVDADAGICAITTIVDGRVVGAGSGAPLWVNATIRASGTATVRVTATDCVGNTAAVTTSFTVPPRPRQARAHVPARTRAAARRSHAARAPRRPTSARR